MVGQLCSGFYVDTLVTVWVLVCGYIGTVHLYLVV